METKEVEKIANAHWKWIEDFIFSMPDSNMWGVSSMEYLYKTAFVHGYKHASQPPDKAD